MINNWTEALGDENPAVPAGHRAAGDDPGLDDGRAARPRARPTTRSG